MMHKQRAYTLIEILIALVIFAILATITSTVMFQAFNTRERLTTQANELSKLQLAMALLTQDFAQVSNRAVRSDNRELTPSFEGDGTFVEFTRSGITNPGAVAKKSTLKHLRYLCQKGNLIRRTWESLDVIKKVNSSDRIILNQLSQCSFAYLANNNQLLEEWRPNSLQQNQKKENSPRAIQLSLTSHTWGNMNVLFTIPEGLYGE